MTKLKNIEFRERNFSKILKLEGSLRKYSSISQKAKEIYENRTKMALPKLGFRLST